MLGIYVGFKGSDWGFMEIGLVLLNVVYLKREMFRALKIGRIRWEKLRHFSSKASLSLVVLCTWPFAYIFVSIPGF